MLSNLRPKSGLLSLAAILPLASALYTPAMHAPYGRIASRNTSTPCDVACSSLAATFAADQVDSPGSTEYSSDQASYWSAFQAETQPGCFFHPNDKTEVAAAIKISSDNQCPFVVVGGGHTPFVNGSNVEGGLTIDFINMKNITVSDDRRIVSLEPGNRWYDVYSTLEKVGLNVLGGRVAHVGVPGLLLGGGISFFSNRYGWAFDSIVNYEVVLASGEIVNANVTCHQDLYWALRGGGGNFGIVTRFDLIAYEQKPLFWGGDRVVDSTIYNNTILDAVLGFAKTGWQDSKAAIEIAFAYEQQYKLWIQDSTLTYMDPQPTNKTHPPVFDAWYKVNATLEDTTANVPPSSLTVSLESSNGKRQLVYTMSTEPDRQLASDILEIWREEVAPMVNFTNILPAIQFQPTSPNVFKYMNRDGGNAVGLKNRNKTLIVMNWSIGWSDPADDAAVHAAYQSITDRVTDLAKSRGLFHPYKYANYAHPSQNPIATYGEENKKKLLAVSAKYDPTGLFQRNPGQFKLDPSPQQLSLGS